MVYDPAYLLYPGHHPSILEVDDGYAGRKSGPRNRGGMKMWVV